MATVEITSAPVHIQRATASAAIRDRILEEHRLLRHRLDFLELAVEGLGEDPKRRGAVNRAARDLLRLLIAHTRLEDAILAPLLRTADAWGEVRARSLLDSHVEQREQLTGLIHSYGANGENAEDALPRTLAWIADVRADMDREERDVLNRELLRDDSVAIDGESG